MNQNTTAVADREAVRTFLDALLRRRNDTNPFGDDESLVLSGRLDSIDVIEIVAFLESEYDFDFGDRPFTLTVLDSVDRISTLIASR